MSNSKKMGNVQGMYWENDILNFLYNKNKKLTDKKWEKANIFLLLRAVML